MTTMLDGHTYQGSGRFFRCQVGPCNCGRPECPGAPVTVLHEMACDADRSEPGHRYWTYNGNVYVVHRKRLFLASREDGHWDEQRPMKLRAPQLRDVTEDGDDDVISCFCKKCAEKHLDVDNIHPLEESSPKEERRRARLPKAREGFTSSAQPPYEELPLNGHLYLVHGRERLLCLHVPILDPDDQRLQVFIALGPTHGQGKGKYVVADPGGALWRRVEGADIGAMTDLTTADLAYIGPATSSDMEDDDDE